MRAPLRYADGYDCMRRFSYHEKVMADGDMMREPNHVFENILTDSLPSVLRGALRPSRFLHAFRDPWTWLLILAGGVGLLWSPQGAAPALAFQILAAFSEETAFRALLQNYAEAWWQEKRREKEGSLLLTLVTPGNLAVSVLFAATHAFAQSPLMAALTFIPSLGLGLLWSRHRSLLACTALHAWYNMLFWW